MKNKIIAYYSIFLGLSVIGLWMFILQNEDISEGKIEMSFHLFSEFLMAIICITSGVAILKNHPKAADLNILGLGMVLYSVINAAGYYGERNELLMIILFFILSVLTLVAIITQLRRMKK